MIPSDKKPEPIEVYIISLDEEKRIGWYSIFSHTDGSGQKWRKPRPCLYDPTDRNLEPMSFFNDVDEAWEFLYGNPSEQCRVTIDVAKEISHGVWPVMLPE